MTNSIKISQLPAATTPLTGAEEVALVQDGVTKQATVTQIGTVTATGSTTARTLANRFADVVNVKDFGAVGNGVTDDTVAINAAIVAADAKSETEILISGEISVSQTLENDYGVSFPGGGAILLGQTGRLPLQLNTYATPSGFAYNALYLDRVMARVSLGPSGGSSKLGITLYGDSTIEGYVAPPATLNGFFLPQFYLPRLFAQAGYANVDVTNAGVSGTNWSSLNVSAIIADTDTDLVILKYGINDGAISVFPLATRLETIATNLRSKLAAIRAGVSRQVKSILIIGPTPTSDDIEGRNEQWYEQLRGLYIKAADDYQCAYFDAYGFLRHVRGLEGIGYDSVTVSGYTQGIHPLEMTIARMWSGIFDSFFSPTLFAYWRSNAYTHTGANFEVAALSAAPTAYDFGTHIKICLAADGWPANGQVVTVRSYDSPAYQTVFSNEGKAYHRATSNGTSWGTFSGVQNAPVFQNSWVNFGGGWITSYTRTIDGIVNITGAVKSGTITAGTTVFTLPVEYRPSGNFYFLASAGVAPSLAHGQVLTTGEVQIVSGWDVNLVSFTFSFPTA